MKTTAEKLASQLPHIKNYFPDHTVATETGTGACEHAGLDTTTITLTNHSAELRLWRVYGGENDTPTDGYGTYRFTHEGQEFGMRSDTTDTARRPGAISALTNLMRLGGIYRRLVEQGMAKSTAVLEPTHSTFVDETGGQENGWHDFEFKSHFSESPEVHFAVDDDGVMRSAVVFSLYGNFIVSDEAGLARVAQRIEKTILAGMRIYDQPADAEALAKRIRSALASA